MKFLDAARVDLTAFGKPKLFGFIYIYELPNGNIAEEYYINKELYLSREICSRTNEIISEEGFDNDYHYSVDLFFSDESRRNYFNPETGGVHFSD